MDPAYCSRSRLVNPADRFLRYRAEDGVAQTNLTGDLAAAFGCYGWSGEGVAKIGKILAASGFALVNDGLKTLWNPDGDAREKCAAFGREIAKA